MMKPTNRPKEGKAARDFAAASPRPVWAQGGAKKKGGRRISGPTIGRP